MRITELKFLVITIFIISFKTVFADSPLTSTPFYQKYTDVDIVLEAEQMGAMNREIADYLHNSNNPIDVKAAVINALGWNHPGKSNADQYVFIIYNSAVISPELLEANQDDAFVVGYLYAMDNYNDTKTAKNYLKQAQNTFSSSYTVNIIYNLVRAQGVMDENFCKAWNYTNKVFLNDQLEMDMRADARKVIYDYMIFYKQYCK